MENGYKVSNGHCLLHLAFLPESGNNDEVVGLEEVMCIRYLIPGPC